MGLGGFPPRTHIFCALPKRKAPISWLVTSGVAGCESVWSGEGTPQSRPVAWQEVASAWHVIAGV